MLATNWKQAMSPLWSLLLDGVGFGLIPAGWVLLFIQTNLLNNWTCWHSHIWLGTESAQEASAGGCTCVL